VVSVSEKAVPVFKTGKEMHKRLNPTLPGHPAKRDVANAAAVGSHIGV
jgi:integration host factor subunit beta